MYAERNGKYLFSFDDAVGSALRGAAVWKDYEKDGSMWERAGIGTGGSVSGVTCAGREVT